MSAPLRSLLLGFSVEVKGEERLDAMDKKVSGIVSGVQRLGTALAGVFLVKQLTGFISDTIDAGSALKLTSERLGVTVDELERYRYATDQNGVSTENADRALQMFNRQLGESEIGSKAATKGIGQLGGGMTAAQLSALPLQDLLAKIADKFQGMTDKSAKTQLAMKLFGRQGAALIPMLDQGAEGMKKWNDEFDALGGGIGGDLATKMLDAERETKKLTFAWNVLKTRLVGDVLPGITKFVRLLTQAALGLEWLQKHTYFAQTALIALGAAAVVAFAPFLISIAPVLALFTSLYLIFDDIFTLFSGGDSTIGAFLNSLLGKDGASALIKQIKADFYAFVDWLKGDGLERVKEFGKGLQAQFEAAKPVLKELLDGVIQLLHLIDGISGATRNPNVLPGTGIRLVPRPEPQGPQGPGFPGLSGDNNATNLALEEEQRRKHPFLYRLADALTPAPPPRLPKTDTFRVDLDQSGDDAEHSFRQWPYAPTPPTVVNITNLNVQGQPGSTGGLDTAISDQVEQVKNGAPVTP